VDEPEALLDPVRDGEARHRVLLAQLDHLEAEDAVEAVLLGHGVVAAGDVRHLHRGQTITSAPGSAA
jgi:hypothetical protein